MRKPQRATSRDCPDPTAARQTAPPQRPPAAQQSPCLVCGREMTEGKGVGGPDGAVGMSHERYVRGRRRPDSPDALPLALDIVNGPLQRHALAVHQVCDNGSGTAAHAHGAMHHDRPLLFVECAVFQKIQRGGSKGGFESLGRAGFGNFPSPFSPRKSQTRLTSFLKSEWTSSLMRTFRYLTVGSCLWCALEKGGGGGDRGKGWACVWASGRPPPSPLTSLRAQWTD